MDSPNSTKQTWQSLALGVAGGLIASFLLPFDQIEDPVYRWFCVLWVVTGFLLLALYPRSGNETTKEDPTEETRTRLPPEVTQSTIVQSKKEQQGYSDPIWIESRDDEGFPSADLRKIAVQTKRVDKSTEDLAIQRISATRPDKSEIELTAMILFDSKSWVAGKHHVLEGEAPQGITPKKAIRNSGIQDEVRASLAIYCIGLASTEFDPRQAEDNTVLSDNRAIRLCNALHELGYIESKSRLHRTVAVGLGERKQDPEDKTPQRRQRAAVIVAATKLDGDDTEAEVIDVIRAGVNTASVSLDKYQRSTGPGFQMYDVTSAKFCEATSDRWDFVDALAERRVLDSADCD